MKSLFAFPLSVLVYYKDNDMQQQITGLFNREPKIKTEYHSDLNVFLQEIEKRNINVAVLDMRSEDKDGRNEMQEALRKLVSAKKGLYIIAIAPKADLIQTMTCFRLGVQKLLLAPFKNLQLKNALESFVQHFESWHDVFEIVVTNKSLERELDDLFSENS